MPRLLNLRALCSHCEKAEATAWSLSQHAALCESCVRRASDPRSVPIVACSAVAALCAQCAQAPAAHIADDGATALCDICATSAARDPRLTPLRDSHVADGIVFDKMDFSSLYDNPRVKLPHTDAAAHVQPDEKRTAVDLSYYKTPVPTSLGRSARKRGGPPDAERSLSAKANSPRRRRK